jgi:hypothetical protein
MAKLFKSLPSIIVVSVWVLGIIILWKMTSGVYYFSGNNNQLKILIVATYLLVWGLLFYFIKGTRTEKSLSFAITNITILIILGIFEFFVIIRVVDFRSVFSTPITDPALNPNYVLDSELIFRHRPNSHITGKFIGGNVNHLFQVSNPGTYHYDVKIDSNGFRNNSDIDAADIAVIGDSFIEGAEVLSSDLLTSRLAVMQRKVVANLGTIHYGPQQELIVLKRYALPLNPEILVWAVYEGNDLRNIYDYRETLKEWENISRKSNSLVLRSFTKNAFLAFSRLFKVQKKSAMKRSGIIKKDGGEEELIYFLFPGNPLSAKDVRALDETTNILSEAYKLSSNKGVKLVVLFIPTKFRVYKNIVESMNSVECNDWVVNDLPTRLHKKISEISDDIGFIDATPTLIESVKNGGNPYFLDDSHWSPEGHLVVAREINKYISTEIKRIQKPTSFVKH